MTWCARWVVFTTEEKLLVGVAFSGIPSCRWIRGSVQ